MGKNVSLLEGAIMPAGLEFVPLSTYLKSEYEPDAEYVDGEIEERPMGEDDHSAWQGAIYFWFRQHSNEWKIRVRPELRLQVAPTRFRVPDVMILDREQPVEQVIAHPPIAVFEVLSPEDTVRRLMRKLNDYQTMGIPEIWVIDPETRAFSRFEDGQLIRRTEFSVPSRGIAFPVSRIESGLE
jgi:Uma2 family endonuclease